VHETDHDNPNAYSGWLRDVRPVVTALTSSLQGVSR
jgi:hypothetical protein